MTKLLIALFAFLLTACCQTPYKEGIYGLYGGYSLKKTNDTYTISYALNGLTTLRKGVDFVALKGSQIAMENGLQTFDLKIVKAYSLTTAGRGGYNSHLVIDIIPNKNGFFEASNICAFITQKYGGVSNADVFKEEINCNKNTEPNNASKQMEVFYNKFQNLDYKYV